MESIKGLGKKKIISDIRDGEGKRIAKEFLNLLLTEFAKQSGRYIKEVYDAPFAYKEKQLHSIFAPAISKITPVFLMELPIEREWSKIKNKDWANSRGWLDYWCRYRNVDFFIELKHDYDCYSTETIRKRVSNNWYYMDKNQLQLVKKEAKIFSEWSKGVFLLSLHVITIYEKTKKNKSPKSIENLEELKWIQRNYYENLRPNPNWSGLWILNNRLAQDCAYETKKYDEYFPGVLFLSRISEIIN
jgi:hypothetical protein